MLEIIGLYLGWILQSQGKLLIVVQVPLRVSKIEAGMYCSVVNADQERETSVVWLKLEEPPYLAQLNYLGTPMHAIKACF